jgi:hypothetical protein
MQELFNRARDVLLLCTSLAFWLGVVGLMVGHHNFSPEDEENMFL